MNQIIKIYIYKYRVCKLCASSIYNNKAKLPKQRRL